MQCDDRGYCGKAVKTVRKDYRGFDKDIERAIRLLGDTFCPTTSASPLKFGNMLHRVTIADSYEVWKLNVSVAGSKLRPSQWPRLWFGVVREAGVIVPLVVARHKDYDMDESRYENEALGLMKAYSQEEQF